MRKIEGRRETGQGKKILTTYLLTESRKATEKLILLLWSRCQQDKKGRQSKERKKGRVYGGVRPQTTWNGFHSTEKNDNRIKNRTLCKVLYSPLETAYIETLYTDSLFVFIM